MTVSDQILKHETGITGKPIAVISPEVDLDLKYFIKKYSWNGIGFNLETTTEIKEAQFFSDLTESEREAIIIQLSAFGNIVTFHWVDL